MPHSIRRTLAAGFVAVLVGAPAVPAVFLWAGSAVAQQQGEAPKQVKLTQKQIDGILAAQPELVAAQPKGGNGEGDPKLKGKMEGIVKKHGFSGLDEYAQVSDSIGIVLGGLDPETKQYVGPTALIKKQIKEVQADKGMKPQDKAEAMKQLKQAMAAGDGAKPEDGNVEIVAKNYDRLAQLMQGGGEGQ